MAEDEVVSVDVSDLPVGPTRAVAIGGRKVLICRVAGEFYAVAERCSGMRP